MEKAEEAVRNEKSLNRYREEQNLGEADMSLAGFVRTFLRTPSSTSISLLQVILHCANMFAKCGMNSEAMNQYNLILKNKLLPIPSRL